MKKLLAIGLIGMCISMHAQNLDNVRVSAKFLRYPTNPLPEEIKTYSTDMYVNSLPAGDSRADIEKAINNAMTLPGYEKVENESDANLTIKVSYYNFQITDRNLVSEDKEKKDDDGKVTKWKEYYYTYSYKFPLHLRIVNKISGDELFDGYVNGSQDYRAAKTSSYRASADAKKTLDVDIKKLKSSLRSDNFSTVSNLIKKRYGYTPTTDYVVLKKIKKFKKYEYPVVDEGVDILSAALSSLEPVENYNTPEFQAEVQKALEKFEVDIQEADYSDKKARVNEKVASAIYNNMALAYYWINDFDKATEMAENASGLKSNSWVNGLKNDVNAKKSRYEANGLIETE